MPDQHNRTRYLAGCRCDTCKKAQSDYQKLRRQKKAAGSDTKLSAVPALPRDDRPDTPPDPAQLTPVIKGVTEQLEKLAGTADQPGLAAAALAMAKILDSPLNIAQHPAAAARLTEILAVLANGGRRKKGNLAAVRDMTAG